MYPLWLSQQAPVQREVHQQVGRLLLLQMERSQVVSVPATKQLALEPVAKKPVPVLATRTLGQAPPIAPKVLGDRLPWSATAASQWMDH
jgi:hypothetical protein